MENSAIALEVVLANTFMMYIRAHAFHWNVTGILFHSMHQYFDNLYNELWQAVDPIAEEIRALGPLAPATLNDLVQHATTPLTSNTTATPGTPNEMIQELLEYNHAVLASLYDAHSAAKEEEHDGLVNFIEERIDKHAKIGWQLKAHLVN
jgi:starvation-inducible DNA-binding protein